MARSLEEIIADLRAWQPGCEDWGRLDSLVDELWGLRSAPRAVEELLAIFERFREEDGHEVFWTILHGLEKLPRYEAALVGSVARKPSEFGVLMVGRLLNAGILEVGGAPLEDLLDSVVCENRAPESVRQTARDFLQRHSAR